MNIFLVLSPAVIWLLMALALLLVELATPGLFFFISFAFGCLFGALGAALGYSLVIQCSAALFVSLVQFNAMRRALRRFNNATHAPTNVDALIGKRAVVTQSITCDVPGQVKVGSELWVAIAESDIAVDTLVQITRIQGNRVAVKPIKRSES